ncbi:hypothetical protein BU15DRAFT_67283 [Melanogaster broomeanus]|nr:hypothetical protein BU15DRAFT_67283 [Melanogaster broomeanus]
MTAWGYPTAGVNQNGIAHVIMECGGAIRWNTLIGGGITEMRAIPQQGFNVAVWVYPMAAMYLKGIAPVINCFKVQLKTRKKTGNWTGLTPVATGLQLQVA